MSTYLNQANVFKTVFLQNGFIKNKQYVLSLANTGREKYRNSISIRKSKSFIKLISNTLKSRT